jgi:hypothetical protein
MYRAFPLLILLFGIHCNPSGVAAPDMGMQPADLARADMSMTAEDLRMGPRARCAQL